MGIQLSDQHKAELKERLKELLTKEGVSNKKTLIYFFVSILSAFEANARWGRIDVGELITLSERFGKKIPDGDFQTTFNRVLVRRVRGVIHREWYSEKTVVKGWHNAVINELRNKHKVRVPAPLVKELFNLGQEFIKKHESV